jgi:alkanesulfonate monooxygenase
MKLGLHVNSFTEFAPRDSPAQLGPALASVAAAAEQAGFSRLTVMDHVWQISMLGDEDEPMLEAYTALGFVASRTSAIELAALVTGTTHRSPGLLAKAVTTLDVLSGGRALLGIGAGWNEEEAIGLGLGWADTSERFGRLQETLQICRQMWSGEDGPFTGKYYSLASTLNSPPALSTPRPRIIVGGAGERTTLKLVARYADECNIFGGPDAPHKFRVLAEHCDREGRDFAAITKTAISSLALDADGGVDGALAQLRRLRDYGFDLVHASLSGLPDPAVLEKFGSSVIPEIAGW